MNDREVQQMEAELRKASPAPCPPELLERLYGAVSPAPGKRPAFSPRLRPAIPTWLVWLRWLAPATAIVLVVLLGGQFLPMVLSAAATGFNADDVHLSEQLVSDFDAVGELPSGEPVRFRCREWKDSAVFHDSKRGLVVEQNTPRLEVVPVAFETY